MVAATQSVSAFSCPSPFPSPQVSFLIIFPAPLSPLFLIFRAVPFNLVFFLSNIVRDGSSGTNASEGWMGQLLSCEKYDPLRCNGSYYGKSPTFRRHISPHKLSLPPLLMTFSLFLLLCPRSPSLRTSYPKSGLLFCDSLPKFVQAIVAIPLRIRPWPLPCPSFRN
jgi:hypothetical protein